MKRFLIIAAALIITLYVAALVVPVDPQERRPGTRLSGTPTPLPDDWSFLPAQARLYVQTATWYGIPHPVTTTSFVSGGKLYVPCGQCDSKRWPRHVARRPDVIVKVGDRLYSMRARPVTDSATLHRVLAGRHLDMPDLALYHMAPADSAARVE